MPGKQAAATFILLIGIGLLAPATHSACPNPAPNPQVVHVLVVPVDFPDFPGTMDFTLAQSDWVDPLTQFFCEVSNGEFDLNVTLVPRVSRLALPRPYYHCGKSPPVPPAECTEAWSSLDPLATLVADGLIDRTPAGLTPPGAGIGSVFQIILFINARNIVPGCGEYDGLLGGSMFPAKTIAVDLPNPIRHYYHLGYATYLNGPCGTDCEIAWGGAAHEIGHALNRILGGGYNSHPAGYQSRWELMDSSMPCSPGIFTRVSSAVLGPAMPQYFPGWIPDDRITVFDPTISAGGTEILAPVEFDPATTTSPMGLKVETSDGTDYYVECRRNSFPERTGCYKDGVLIIKALPPGEINPGVPTKVHELQLAPGFSDSNPDPVCTRRCNSDGVACTNDAECAPGETCEFALDERRWKSHFLPGDSFTDTANDLSIDVGPFVAGGACTVTVTYGPMATTARPDVGILPWLSEPMSTYETVDIWVDSECNGYEDDDPADTTRLKYGKRPDGTVIHNGDDPCVDHHNRLYATVRNLGTAAADNVVVHFDRTDPMGVGIWGSAGWVPVGTATVTEFAELASIPPGDTATVWVDWVPDSADIPFFDDTFNFHSCVRVRIDSVSGEVLLANQDGEREQENIDFFEIRRDLDLGTYQAVDGSVFLDNAGNVIEQFVLGVETEMPADWNLAVGDGSERYALGPGETRTLDVHLDVPGGTPVGQSYFVEVSAFALRPDDSPDVSIDFSEPEPYSGLMFEARTVHASRFIAMNAEPNPPDSCNPASLAASGCLEPAVPGVQVTLDYVPPDGGPTISRQTPTDANGCFNDNISTGLTGDWGVRAIFQGIAEFGSAVSDLIPAPVYDPADVDCDLIPNVGDNCPLIVNPGQADLDLDGAGDACDCSVQDPTVFAAPFEVTGVRVLNDKKTLIWDSMSGATGSSTTYDGYRGALGEFPVGTGLAEVCDDDIAGTSISDDEFPTPGQGFWYLIRGQNSCGNGTLGTWGSDVERSSTVCP